MILYNPNTVGLRLSCSRCPGPPEEPIVGIIKEYRRCAHIPSDAEPLQNTSRVNRNMISIVTPRVSRIRKRTTDCRYSEPTWLLMSKHVHLICSGAGNEEARSTIVARLSTIR